MTKPCDKCPRGRLIDRHYVYDGKGGETITAICNGCGCRKKRFIPPDPKWTPMVQPKEVINEAR